MFKTSDSKDIRLTRVYDAPVSAVWDAWTDPDQVAQWWGPRGFTLTSHSKDLRAGGTWRYTMHGPDGVDYPNVTQYLEVEPQRRLVYDHGGSDDTPPLFRVTVTFAESNGRTTMDMVSTLPTPERATEMARFIKKAGGNATWDRLAEHLAPDAARFVINRTFDAPIARVFEMWTNPEHLAQWLPPKGTRLRFLRSEIARGKGTFFVITGAHGPMYVRADYLTIEAPHRIVYTQQFVDEAEQLASGPTAWPATLRNTIDFVAESAERTRVTLTTEPDGPTTAAERDAFSAERAGMTQGWSSSFDALEPLFEPQLLHGTRADLKPGDLIEAGRRSNYGQRKEAKFVYLSATLDAATWGAELAHGEGAGRIYIVAPTGPIEDDPNLTDKRFPGNPTKSYRTREPLRVVGEITDWKPHAPEVLQHMKDNLARLAAQGIEAIED